MFPCYFRLGFKLFGANFILQRCHPIYDCLLQHFSNIRHRPPKKKKILRMGAKWLPAAGASNIDLPPSPQTCLLAKLRGKGFFFLSGCTVLRKCQWTSLRQLKWTGLFPWLNICRGTFRDIFEFFRDVSFWIFVVQQLRGPIAILFISRDTCSDSIAKLFCACFLWGIAQLSRDMLQNGVSHRCAFVKLSTKGGVSHHIGEVLSSLKKYRAIWGIAAIVSQYRAIWAH